MIVMSDVVLEIDDHIMKIPFRLFNYNKDNITFPMEWNTLWKIFFGSLCSEYGMEDFQLEIKNGMEENLKMESNCLYLLVALFIVTL